MALRSGTSARAEALAVRAPFHLQATVRVLQRRPTNLVDVYALGAALLDRGLIEAAEND